MLLTASQISAGVVQETLAWFPLKCKEGPQLHPKQRKDWSCLKSQSLQKGAQFIFSVICGYASVSRHMAKLVPPLFALTTATAV